MSTTSAFLILLSGTLIGVGVTMLVRDARTRRGGQRLAAAQAPAGRQLRDDPQRQRVTAGGADSAARSRGEAAPRADAAWAPIAARLGPALRAVNGAFSHSGAKIVPSLPLSSDAGLEHEVLLRVEAGQAHVGDVRVALRADALEVYGIPAGAAAAGVRKARRMDAQTANIQVVAEAIAACAWPAIALHRARRAP